MKKKEITISVIIILLLAALSIPASNPNFLYPKACIITAIDYEKDLVTIETASGLIYEFYGVEDYDTGDLVAVLFFGGVTEKVTDDIILMHRYSGWPELFLEK